MGKRASGLLLNDAALAAGPLAGWRGPGAAAIEVGTNHIPRPSSSVEQAAPAFALAKVLMCLPACPASAGPKQCHACTYGRMVVRRLLALGRITAGPRRSFTHPARPGPGSASPHSPPATLPSS